MKMFNIEKALLTVALLSVSTAVLSSLPPNIDLLSTTFSPQTKATTLGRGLSEPRRVSSAYVSKDRKGRVVVVDPQNSVAVKGTMAGAMADSYQGAQYLTQRDLQKDVRAIN